ncbi:MAG: M23 family metallopeptidase, partial [Acidimicrobiales bacterium]
LKGAEAALSSTLGQAAAADAGELVASAGFVFPVAGPRAYANGWGAPRMVGTPFEHFHEGTDIFAAADTPLVACERGVVVRVGTDRLGGIKLWLVGASGTRYYYAHLSAFAPGVVDGLVVEAGTLIGSVGSTGNAQGGSPHLHFEVHPAGGPAVNPYPFLRLVDDAARRYAAGGQSPTSTTTPRASPPPRSRP